MKRVGVSITAVPGASLLLLFLALLFLSLNLPLFCWNPPLLLFWAYSTFKVLPICSIPLNYKALLNEFLEENFTKADPFDLPSGFVSNLTLRMLPHSSNKSLISESYALKESPMTIISNSPSSSSSAAYSSISAGC